VPTDPAHWQLNPIAVDSVGLCFARRFKHYRKAF